MRLSVPAAISHGRVHRRLGLGPRSRLDLLRNLVTALVRHERIEAPWARADEMRGYAEKEKDLIHKLFKVLAPRFQPHPGSYTRLLQIPNRDGLDRAKMAVIELKGNPFPPLIRPHRDSEKTLLNQLLKGYREDLQWAPKG
ncbi:RM17 protein, partial [Chroicocephalus maculipennis]|nr:RM17 protein [Chroicocephalus maculipennis]